MNFEIIAMLVASLVFGALVTFFLERRRSEARVALAVQEITGTVRVLEERLSARDSELAEKRLALEAHAAQQQHLRAELKVISDQKIALESALAHEKRQHDEKVVLLTQAQEQFKESFQALSAEALRSNNQSFLALAAENFQRIQDAAKGELDKKHEAVQALLAPVKDTLLKVDTQIHEIEKSRVGAYEALTQQVRILLDSQGALKQETQNLVRALGTPRVRGRWGEIQLKRVVELAGMLDHCDFQEQQSVSVDETRLRPDLIVRLPGGKNIVVDAKAPLAGYLEALEAETEEIKLAKLDAHARHIREHLAALSKKSYWEQFEPSPEFVILFLPGETFFSAALERDPALIEQGVEQRVILATPTTLITLLKAVAYGWRQEAMTKNAEEICALGKELYKRMSDLGSHFQEVGHRLGKAVEAYNRSIGTLETRVMVSARKFHELEARGAHDQIELVTPVEVTPRQITAVELRGDMPLALEQARLENN
jgi:DNA recombination protein RmuC